MTTELAKWGNSLAVRIPKSPAERAQLAPGDRVSLEISGDGGLVIRAARPRYGLADLVKRITPRNRHRETEWGGRVGNEQW